MESKDVDEKSKKRWDRIAQSMSDKNMYVFTQFVRKLLITDAKDGKIPYEISTGIRVAMPMFNRIIHNFHKVEDFKNAEFGVSTFRELSSLPDDAIKDKIDNMKKDKEFLDRLEKSGFNVNMVELLDDNAINLALNFLKSETMDRFLSELSGTLAFIGDWLEEQGYE